MSDEKVARMWENTERSLAREEGIVDCQVTIIKSMLNNDFKIEEINRMINISVYDIEQLLNKNN